MRAPLCCRPTPIPADRPFYSEISALLRRYGHGSHSEAASSRPRDGGANDKGHAMKRPLRHRAVAAFRCCAVAVFLACCPPAHAAADAAACEQAPSTVAGAASTEELPEYVRRHYGEQIVTDKHTDIFGRPYVGLDPLQFYCSSEPFDPLPQLWERGLHSRP